MLRKVPGAQVNVTNVPLSLKEWSLDTRLLGRKALVASLTRHYFSQFLVEAHKVRLPPSSFPLCMDVMQESPAPYP